MDRAFLDWALESFSGSVAADELYEGPYCVLSVIDNRADKRILHEVLGHDPTPDDITALLERLKRALTHRDLDLQGITTDGYPLYPEPIRTGLDDVAHQKRRSEGCSRGASYLSNGVSNPASANRCC
jgi:hypothetical protein